MIISTACPHDFIEPEFGSLFQEVPAHRMRTACPGKLEQHQLSVYPWRMRSRHGRYILQKSSAFQIRWAHLSPERMPLCSLRRVIHLSMKPRLSRYLSMGARAI